MKERLIKNWISTIIGIAIIAAAIYMLMKEMVTDYFAFGAIVAIGFSIMWSKDGKLKKVKLPATEEEVSEAEKSKKGIHRKTPENNETEI